MKQLAVGVQDFSTLIEEGYLYVDKTELIYNLLKGKGFFLSRPRRFGKSLLVSTFEAIYKGYKKLFEDCWIHQSDYDWMEYPVIKLDFSMLVSSTKEELVFGLEELLRGIASEHGIELKETPHPSYTFQMLIQKLNEKCGKKVVILIDEYDVPILDNINSKSLMDQILSILNKFFVVIKSHQAYIKFAFITGVSRFSKVSLFSGMNHLDDISFDGNYASLLGITEEELDHYYKESLSHSATHFKVSQAELRDKIRQWYNGYRFSRVLPNLKVYNPISLHQFFNKEEFQNYWFNTATPTFALKLIQEKNFSLTKFETGMIAGPDFTDTHDLNAITLPKLLYQTGYLTIADYDPNETRYTLHFPNKEVEQSFFLHLLHTFTKLDTEDLDHYHLDMIRYLKSKDLNGFFKTLNSLFASIPFDLHLKNEAYYHSLFYLLLKGMGLSIEAEVPTNRGRIDLVLMTNGLCYLFELKFNRSAKEAMQQIKERGYPEKYMKKALILVGLNINSSHRSIDEWVQEEL